MDFKISLLLVIICALCQSCFTGIESTPKISIDDSADKTATIITEEQKLLSHIQRQPFDKWQKGKEFVVTDNKISLIFNSSPISLVGDTIKYCEYTTFTSVDGSTATQIFFTNSNCDTLSYIVNSSPQKLAANKSFEIPFTVQLDMINDVKEILLNNKYYIITPLAYDADDNNISQPKYIQVTINDVTTGNHLYPIKISYTNEFNKSANVYMTVGNEIQSTRNFETLFSLNNPRLKYPKITESHWNNIVNNMVTLGMTKEECRLSLGSPTSVERLPSYSGVIEFWKYSNGYQLTFEDGLLKNIKR